ncbi:MAG: type I 3-dehydroquinate dehydratase [Planctomycetota bacterium]|nr:type I 3-dehydroquinate dehydratase [Planctomycetota bacterium]
MIVAVVAETDSAAVAARLGSLAGPPWAGHVTAEVRLDTLADPDVAIAALSGAGVPVLATCRRLQDGGAWRGTEDGRRALLQAAFDANVEAIDVEVDVLADLPFARGDRVVASFHDFHATPDGLDETIARAFDEGAGRVKVATRANDLTDLLRLRRVVDSAAHPDRVTAFALGPVGIASRILFRRMGADRVYAHATDAGGRELAPGLPALADLAGLYYADATLSAPIAGFGVLGDRATDSIGPTVFNRIFRGRGVPAIYVPITAPSTIGLREAMRLLGIRGLSVTIPHKEAALTLADDVHDLATRIGAANTLVFEEGRLRAFNTDYHGVLEPVRDARMASQARAGEAVVLGAGGAARAAAAALSDLGLKTRICSRTADRAIAAASALGVEAGPVPTEPPAVLVNATPVGGLRDPDGIPVPASALGPGQVVLEMNYLPADTPLLRAAREAGGVAIDGAAMFSVQARHQLHHFWAGLPDLKGEIEETVRWAIEQRASS